MRSEDSPLRDVVKGVIGSLSGKGRIGQEEIAEAWEAAAGKAAAKHSRPAGFKKAILTVNVDGSSWLYELTTKKKEILKGLERKIVGRRIVDIRFRIGEVR